MHLRESARAPGVSRPLADFLSAEIKQFGVVGINNRIEGESTVNRKAEEYASRGASFSCNGHFAFGFDENAFCDRPNPSARYWTEYGGAATRHGTLVEELAVAADEIYRRFGDISVNAYGGQVSALLCIAGELSGRSYERVAVMVSDGEPPSAAALPGAGLVRDIRLTLKQCMEFCRSFCVEFQCANPWIALDALAAEYANSAFAFDCYSFHLEDSSYDEFARRFVGPPSWSLVDHEAFASIGRWLLRSRRDGIPSIARWSPALMAAIMEAAPNADAIRDSMRNDKRDGRQWRLDLLARLAETGLVGVGAPGGGRPRIGSGVGAAYAPTAIVSAMSELRRTFQSLFPENASKCRTSAGRLFRHLRCSIAEDFTWEREMYGDVRAGGCDF